MLGSLFRRDKKALDELFATYGNLVMPDEVAAHPMQNWLENNPDKLQKYLQGNPFASLYQPEVKAVGEERAIILKIPDDEKAREVAALAEHEPNIRVAVFQRFFKDLKSNTIKNVSIKGKFGNTVLRFNNIGALGDDVAAGSRVNLVVGASETWHRTCTALNPDFYYEAWSEQLEVPYNELGETINGAIEGAHYPLIEWRAKTLTSAIIDKGAQIENLFVFGGWHNLIYGYNKPANWRSYMQNCTRFAPRTVFFEIVSPSLYFGFKDYADLVAEGFPFWGSLEFNEAAFEELRNQILAYNEELRNFCSEHDNAISVPLPELMAVTKENTREIFNDINHFKLRANAQTVVANAVNEFLQQERDFFVPNQAGVSDYIYPTF